MHTLKISTALLSLASSVTLAAPVDDVSPNYLNKRVTYGDGSTRNKPKRAVFDIDNWRDIAEVNCYIMLCILGGNRIFQRQPNQQAADAAYNDAGAANQPFQDAGISQYGTTRASSSTTSPEDFPWRSIQLGPNERRYLTGVPPPQQPSQGGSLTTTYQAQGYAGQAQGGEPIGYGEWFEIDFLATPPFGEMCNALFSTPQDFSKCGKKKKFDIFGSAGVILANLVYYWVKNDGKFYHATVKGASKREVDSVQWNTSPEDIVWARLAPDEKNEIRRVAELVKARKISIRDIIELDEGGNELFRSRKRGVVELDEAGNELTARSSAGRRAGVVVEPGDSGNELPGSRK